ncbi:hypothetical protein JNE31_07590 [Streptococcus suis]|uniref:RHS repeat-associated core domain-containing protein n=1 Tax=Streptococcus suis TaxID=1307 RepID=UPI00192DB166|nr:pre-toxin TG domain-containing protein [Streptococcus suis]MBL6504228.1 hypothetical protein [Streptococcus suis]
MRARYYDSSVGTFLSEDSYQGELTDPLSQNRYTYVHNNPVNYTDPSGHFWKSIKKAASKVWNGVKKAASNAWNTVKRVATNTWNTVKSAVSHAVNWVGNKVSQAVNWVGTQVNHVKNWAVQQWNNYHSAPSYQASSGSYGGGYNSPSSSHAYAQQQQAQARAQAEQRRQQHIRAEYSQSTGIKTTPKTREAKSMFRNWGKALKEMYTHVCKTAKRVKKQVANYVKKIDWKKVVKTSAYIAGEFFSVNDIYRVITGKDPLTGEKASRLEAAAWLTADLLTMGGSKAAKVAKVASKANKVADTVKASKAVSKVNKAIDAGKTFVKSGINKVLDTPIGFSRQVAMAGGPAMDIGGATLREAGQYVQKGWDNMVQAFAKNGDEVVEGSGKGSNFKNKKLTEETYNNHILDRHGPHSTKPNKSKFYDDFDIKKEIEDTLNDPKTVIQPNTKGREGGIITKTFDSPIGISPTGKQQSTIKIVVDSDGKVITAYPVK